MKRKRKQIFTNINKTTIIEYISIVKMEGPVYLKMINSLLSVAKANRTSSLVGTLPRKRWKTDAEFFSDLEKIVKNIISVADDLQTVIEENLPENINLYSSNYNISIAIFLLSIIRFVIDLPDFLDNVIDYYDRVIKKKENMALPYSKSFIIRFMHDIIELENNKLTDVKNIEMIIESIGNYPAGENMVNSVPLKIREDVISGILGDTKLGKILTRFVSSFKTATLKHSSKKNTHTRNKNLNVGFSGNPIYHIRKIIADLEINNYEKRKLEKKKLELKVQYLKEKASKDMDRKKIEIYKKQIEILDEKIERLDAKIRAFEEKIRV